MVFYPILLIWLFTYLTSSLKFNCHTSLYTPCPSFSTCIQSINISLSLSLCYSKIIVAWWDTVYEIEIFLLSDVPRWYCQGLQSWARAKQPVHTGNCQRHLEHISSLSVSVVILCSMYSNLIKATLNASEVKRVSNCIVRPTVSYMSWSTERVGKGGEGITTPHVPSTCSLLNQLLAN